MLSPNKAADPETNLKFLSGMSQITAQPVTFEGTTIVIHRDVLERLNFSLKRGIEDAAQAVPEGYRVEFR